MTTSWPLAMGRDDFARTALVCAPTPTFVQSHTRRSMPGLAGAKHGLKSSTMHGHPVNLAAALAELGDVRSAIHHAPAFVETSARRNQRRIRLMVVG